MPYSYRMTSKSFYSAHYHRQHSTLHAFEQFGTLHKCTALMTNIRPPGIRVSSHNRIE